MSWRDVPEPRRIASRAHDRRGFPVPFVAQSQPEKDSLAMRWGTKADGILEGILLVSHRGWKRSGSDTPPTARPPWQLGEMNEERQRQCMLAPRCQVCALPLPPDGPWLHVAGAAYFEATTAFREPPVCATCCEYALQVCPALVAGRTHKDDVRVFTVTRRSMVVQGVSASQDPADSAEPRRRIVEVDVARLLSQLTGRFVVYNVIAGALDWSDLSSTEWLAGRTPPVTAQGPSGTLSQPRQEVPSGRVLGASGDAPRLASGDS